MYKMALLHLISLQFSTLSLAMDLVCVVTSHLITVQFLHTGPYVCTQHNFTNAYQGDSQENMWSFSICNGI